VALDAAPLGQQQQRRRQRGDQRCCNHMLDHYWQQYQTRNTEKSDQSAEIV
jgi:hypothetical protein